jgi:hypothetical protein
VLVGAQVLETEHVLAVQSDMVAAVDVGPAALRHQHRRVETRARGGRPVELLGKVAATAAHRKTRVPAGLHRGPEGIGVAVAHAVHAPAAVRTDIETHDMDGVVVERTACHLDMGLLALVEEQPRLVVFALAAGERRRGRQRVVDLRRRTQVDRQRRHSSHPQLGHARAAILSGSGHGAVTPQVATLAARDGRHPISPTTSLAWDAQIACFRSCNSTQSPAMALPALTPRLPPSIVAKGRNT